MVSLFPILYSTKFCKLHFPVLFPCNFHTYLSLPFCVQEILLLLSIHQAYFPPPRFVLLVHNFLLSSLFLPYFIKSGFIPSVPAALLLYKFLIAFFPSSIVSSSTSTSTAPISLFPFLINSVVSFLFSNLSQYFSIFLLFPLYSLPVLFFLSKLC